MGVSNWLIGTVTVIYCVLPLVSTQTCNQHIWCNDCIAADKSCAWCQDQIFRKERCSPKQDLIDKGCVDIFFPNNTMEKLKDDALQDGGMDKNPIQLQPQHINLHLRKGKSQSFNMKYRVANNVPIDMYFVLDFSTTMSTQIKLLADLTDNLVKGLQDKFSTNIYIGFGSFLDKPIQPFHITTPRNLENPCHKVPDMTCEPAYGYKHKRRLGSNIDEFIETVRNANTSVNNDPMEGGLDAIVQAAVCPDIIGWRNQSRRVMVYISDGGFHFAGDGKLAGIDKPFDGLCHMDLDAGTGEYIYSQSTRQDYPSLGHVAKILDDNDINAFFVVSEEVIYREFTKMLKQADTTSLDIKGAKNIVTKITEYYDELSSRLTMAAADIPDEVEVLIASNCGYGPITTTDAKKTTRECKYLQRNKTIDFNVTVTLTKCPLDRSKKGGRFKILPEGIQELLEVQMDYICDCECAKNETFDEYCSNGNGTYECGACRCDPGRSGELCQCDNSDNQPDSYLDEDNCKKDNSSDVICETRGVCVCGQCQCNKDFEGKFCECDMSRCYAQAGKQTKHCSGHGECLCGECQCTAGYYKEHCQCPPNSVCLGKNGLECSGNGRCECGQCVCATSDYKGEFCSECPRCEKCRKCGYKECVDCLDRHDERDNATIFAECAQPCAELNMSHIKRLNRFETGETPCGRFDDANCEISYTVVCDDTENSDPYLQIAKTKQCPNPPDRMLIAMSLLAGIIGVGILLLIIWKILTSFYDKIEYARFEHEVSNPKWTKGENPIYHSPVTNVQNPCFDEKMGDRL